MKTIGFSILFGYRFVCDCGKRLACPFYKTKGEASEKSVYYKQCENCGRIYTISIQKHAEFQGEESSKIDDLMTKISALNLEASRLSQMGQVELLYNPGSD